MFLEIKNERFERAYSYYLMLDECPKLGKASRKQIEFYLKYKLNILTDEDGKFKILIPIRHKIIRYKLRKKVK